MKRMINNKGITLVALVITIVISLLLIVTVSVSFGKVKQTNDYYKIKEDIIALQKQVQLYYLKEGILPLDYYIIENDFLDTIKSSDNVRDRNPNDNNTYYVLYDGTDEIPKEYYGDKLPEVNIQSKGSKYVMNAYSLTVYCTDGYELDNGMHFTASADFSGGKFASEYYQYIDELDLGNLTMSCSTNTNINGKAYPLYAALDSKITIKFIIPEGTAFYSADGVPNTNITFKEFDQGPNKSKIKMKITSIDGEFINSKYLTDNNSTINLSDDGRTCTIIINLDGIDTSDMKNRRKITFSYEDEMYYEKNNKIDYKNSINNYFSMVSIEFEDNKEEVLIASTMNESSGLDNFLTNIKKISGWEHKHTYTDIISTSLPNEQKKYYAIKDARTFDRAYEIVLTFKSKETTINDVDQYIAKASAVFKADNNNANYTSNSAVVTPDIKKITATSSCSGFEDEKTDCGTVIDKDKTIEVKFNPITYTFTLKSNTSGSALTLINTTRSSDFVASGSESDQTRTVKAYIGDVIKYNVKKDYYRLSSDQVGKTASDKTHTMVASNETKNIQLVKNTPMKQTKELQVDTKCIWKLVYVDRDQQEKTISFEYAKTAYNNVQKVELYVVYSYDIWSDKGIEYNISFSNNGFNTIKKTGWKLDDNETDGPYTIYNSNEWPSNYVIPKGSTCTIYQKQNYNQASTYTTKSYCQIYCAEE